MACRREKLERKPPLARRVLCHVACHRRPSRRCTRKSGFGSRSEAAGQHESGSRKAISKARRSASTSLGSAATSRSSASPGRSGSTLSNGASWLSSFRTRRRTASSACSTSSCRVRASSERWPASVAATAAGAGESARLRQLRGVAECNAGRALATPWAQLGAPVRCLTNSSRAWSLGSSTGSISLTDWVFPRSSMVRS